MPKKVCLVEPKHIAHYDFEYVPTGLLSIAATLLTNGHDVSIYRDGDRIPSCDILGVSSSMGQYSRAVSIAKNVDARAKVIGGSFPTVLPVDAIMTTAFDYGIVGDGEIPMLQLANGVSEKNIPGLCYKHRGAIVVNPKLDMLPGEMPIPAHELWNSGKYININKVRGWAFDGDRWRYRPRLRHNRAFDQEIKLLNDLGVESVFVVDEVFCGGRRDIVCAIRSLDRFRWWACRADTKMIIESRLDQRLVGSNCGLLELDIFTASHRLLSDFGMPSVEKHELALELLEGVVDVRVHVTIGIPGETIGSLEETEAWISGRKTRISTFVPYPGSDVFENPDDYSQYGFEVTGCDYSDYAINDLEPVYDVPWKSDVIKAEKFLAIRNRLVREYNSNVGIRP